MRVILKSACVCLTKTKGQDPFVLELPFRGGWAATERVAVWIVSYIARTG